MFALRFSAVVLAGLATLCLSAGSLPGQDRSYGRSVVSTQYGIVATSQVSASQAGARILEQGGSAIDAAIAANAVLNVTEPTSNGLGGDLFAIYWEAKTGKIYGINASGWAPKTLTIEHLREKGVTAMPQYGIDSVTVPGVVDGWTKLHARWGKLPWRELFQPAIVYADQGFPVAEIIHDWWNGDREELLKNAESTRVFLPGGKTPETGEVFRNPDVAHALRLVAEQGEGAFYKGEIAQAILKTSQALGGTMTAEDLASYSAEWVEPISTQYRDWTVYELPPNGDGIAALEMLNIMEQFKPDPAGAHSPGELHTRIEAMKLAYADVKAYVGDPRFSKIPVDQLLSKAYAAKRASLIDPAKANCTVAPGALGKSDTTYFTVADREGNILSVIQSNYNNFGSNVTVLGMGFALQDRGGLFSLDPASPNALAGRKRPFHTIIPAFMQHGDQHIGFGIMGGLNQPLAHAQFVSNVVDYHMNIQAAMEEPRFTDRQQLGCRIVIESRVTPATLDALTRMGHVLQVHPDYTSQMGRGQAILHDSKTGVNSGASDPRADGAAIPEQPDFSGKSIRH
ncbi:gamma-glutamyltransferase [Terracidiphilus sp.]|uniref:gamma-glutamyltransferase n=1 Tax=Terracidiphilus sp. TaxID=1964191 RepID=UPI003C29825C